MSYLQFALRNRRFLCFGLLMTFGSSIGQTFFIGVFGPSIQAEFELSHGGWGTIYMLGTLLSAALLPWTGQWIDRMPLSRYAALVCIGSGVACLLAAAVPSTWLLVLVIFALRQMGQGLASHTAMTSMVKFFRNNRGKAIAIALIGHPVARSVMPLAAVTAIAAVGWRATYFASAALCLLVMLPLAMWLLRGRIESRLHDPEAPTREGDARRPVVEGDRSLGQLLRDPFFWLVVPGVIAPAIIDTALFFHQLTIAELKGWSASWVTAGYMVFSAAVIVVSLGMGPLVDRFGAIRLMPSILLPLGASILVLAWFDHPAWAWVYLGVAGLASGVRATIIPAMWAERCGARHIGAVKSLVATLSVFGSAFGPALMGLGIDAGLGLDTMLYVTVGCLVAITIGLCYAARLRD
ncbi:MAG: MFS transporter [Gammaproteobacteria bacterium]|nr:MFS transporter [Gammaproteobacteria bacterium]